MWLRKVNVSNMWTTLLRLLTSCLRKWSRMRISSCACRWNRFSLRMIFSATSTLFLWSFAFITWPKLPRPRPFVATSQTALTALTLYGHINLKPHRYTSIRWLVGCYILVQRRGAWAGCGPTQYPLRCTKCNSPPINGQCTNFISFDNWEGVKLSSPYWPSSGPSALVILAPTIADEVFRFRSTSRCLLALHAKTVTDAGILHFIPPLRNTPLEKNGCEYFSLFFSQQSQTWFVMWCNRFYTKILCSFIA